MPAVEKSLKYRVSHHKRWKKCKIRGAEEWKRDTYTSTVSASTTMATKKLGPLTRLLASFAGGILCYVELHRALWLFCYSCFHVFVLYHLFGKW